ncbi:MAG TPA: glycosyltransferase, partial [Acidimicrobiales bacterium]
MKAAPEPDEPRARVLAWPAWRTGTNPYTALLSDALEANGVAVEELSPRRALAARDGVVHVHWPEAFLDRYGLPRAALQAAAQLAVLSCTRRRGNRVVWTVHNLGSHDRRHPRLEGWYLDRFAGLVDGWISLSHAAIDPIVAAFPPLDARPRRVIPHGHYRRADAEPLTRSEARAQLDLPADGAIVLSFGALRDYKGIPDLIRAFRAFGALRAVGEAGAVLRVVGEGDRAVVRACLAAAAGDPSVTITERFVPEPEVSAHFASADLVALPYLRGLNSGAALLALSCNRPVLVPDTPAFRELQAMVGREWVRTFEPPLRAGALAAALDEVRDRTGCEKLDLTPFDLAGIAASTASFYEEMAGARPVTVTACFEPAAVVGGLERSVQATVEPLRARGYGVRALVNAARPSLTASSLACASPVASTARLRGVVGAVRASDVVHLHAPTTARWSMRTVMVAAALRRRPVLT